MGETGSFCKKIHFFHKYAWENWTESGSKTFWIARPGINSYGSTLLDTAINNLAQVFQMTVM
jgi:hypothetical protein